jgi:hypothetical protein
MRFGRVSCIDPVLDFFTGPVVVCLRLNFGHCPFLRGGISCWNRTALVDQRTSCVPTASYSQLSSSASCRRRDKDRFNVPASRTFEHVFFAARHHPIDSDQPHWIAAFGTEGAVDGFGSMRSDSGAMRLMHNGPLLIKVWAALPLWALIEINRDLRTNPGGRPSLTLTGALSALPLHPVRPHVLPRLRDGSVRFLMD